MKVLPDTNSPSPLKMPPAKYPELFVNVLLTTVSVPGVPVGISLLLTARRSPLAANAEGQAVRLELQREASEWNRVLGFNAGPAMNPTL